MVELLGQQRGKAVPKATRRWSVLWQRSTNILDKQSLPQPREQALRRLKPCRAQGAEPSVTAYNHGWQLHHVGDSLGGVL